MTPFQCEDRMNRKDWIHVSIILLLLCIGFMRYKNQNYTSGQTKFLLNTLIEINAVSQNKDIDKIVEKAFSLIEEYELKFSYFHPDSELYQMNNSEQENFSIDDEFYEVLRLAEKIYYESSQLYDVTIAYTLDIWDFETEIVPDSLTIQASLLNIGFDKLTIGKGNLYKPTNIKINLGSLSKGYIVDKVIEYLIDSGVKEAYINAGGDIRFFSQNKKKWRVGVQHPRERMSRIAVLQIPDMAVVTSGDYERFFVQDERRYHHIMNPKTGYPTQQTAAVTILSPTAFVADALSTAAMVMMPDDALEMIKTYPDTEAIIYYFDENEELVSIQTEGIGEWIVDN